jgi:uncharacterized protein YdeI (YjbR/CyaY-like superfamily)
MVHVTCDLCGKDIRPGEDNRYVLKMETYTVSDPSELTEADLDEDHMEAISQVLRDIEENETAAEVAEARKSFRFDLCADCHRRFAQNPLAKEPMQKFDFSKN